MKKVLSFMLAFAMAMSLVVTGAGKTVVANAEENVKNFSIVFNENSITEFKTIWIYYMNLYPVTRTNFSSTIKEYDTEKKSDFRSTSL